MVSGYTAVADPDTSAKALGREMPVSPKFAREVAGMIRGMKVETAQKALEDVIAKTTEVGENLVELHHAITAAMDSGKYTDAELDAIRAVARDAQFYWDFVFVENSNGAHNSKLTYRCLDKAAALTEQAMGMFK